MRPFILLAVTVMVLLLGFVGFRVWPSDSRWPKSSTEITQLTPAKRVMLAKLRAEKKFQPFSYPPLEYTGAESPDDELLGTRAVDGVIDAILARDDGPLPAAAVSKMIGDGARKVNLLATEDRDRAQDYMLEIWYLLGFRGATGRFAYGSAFKPLPGYGEPLPPGWASPERPRSFEP